MKKVIAWLLVLALTAAISIGATLAYLTDTDDDVNVMTLGKVKIDQLEYERIDDETKDEDAKVQEFHDNKPLYPGVYEDGFDFGTEDNYVNWDQIGKEGYTSGIWNPEEINNEVDKMVFVKNKGDYDAYVRSVFAFEAGNYTTLEEFQKMVHLNLNETDWTWEWAETPVTIGGSKYFVATATYNKVLAPGALTEISLSQIALDKTATNEDVEAFGDTYQVLVKSQAIQADGFDDPDIALTEGFGEIITNVGTEEIPELEVDTDEIPFENDNPIKGTNLYNALHYLEGDTSTSAITAKVTSVTFGLNESHEEIVNNYDGTLVDVEQDVPVYAYYVPNGSNYDVYFLANDDIYTPVDSSGLFRDMTALTSLNADNLNTGRTEIFNDGFRSCTALTTIDVSDWNVHSLKTATRMFRQCTALTSADISGWNAPNLTDASQLYYGCSALQTADLSNWNVPALTSTYYMFGACGKLQSVNFTGWKTGSLENMSWMFASCTSLETVPGIENFDVSSVTTMQGTFYGCSSLQFLDLTNWAPSKVTDMYCMFQDCKSMVELKADTWKLDSVTTTQYMFIRCTSLETVEATNWGMPNNQNLQAMFRECGALETLKSTNWTIDAAKDLSYIFLFCKNLKNVDTANWQTGNVTDMRNAFNGCQALEYVDVSNWDVSKVTNFNSMFSGSDSNSMDMSLKEIDLSKWNPASVTNLNHMFYGCAQLTEIDMSGWVMPNLYTTSHMFADCINLEVIDVSGWQTSEKWLSMDAMFNDCRKVKFLDVSSFTTSGVTEFSQIFEACWALEEIKGLENWDTSNGKSFDQTFLTCSSLKELNLSGWNTGNAMYGNKHLNGDISQGFNQTFSGANKLEKLILGENFDFDGNGTVTVTATLPNPGNVDGQTAMWYNAANDTYYTASEIPEPKPGDDTVTYVAAIPPAENP